MIHVDTFIVAKEKGANSARRWLWLTGLVPPALPVLGYLLVQATGLPLFYWFGPIFVYGFVAIVDIVAGVEKTGCDTSDVATLENESYYRFLALLVMPIQYASLVWRAWMLARGGLNFFDSLGLALTLGLANGIAIANAHELGHKSAKLERCLAKFVLAPCCFGHFTTEHNGSHHIWAATPEDFSSARMGESFYAYFWRTLIGAIKEAWLLEKRRLARRGRSTWTWRNDVLSAWLISPLLFGALAAWLGWSVLPWLILQALVGLVMLEMVTYVQHYGLLRARRPDGRYQPCERRHSWNSGHLATNLLLYNLPRHSDHHAHPMRNFQALSHVEDAPQLPTGYAGMSVIALIPPLWGRMVDPALVAHSCGDLNGINIHPPARLRLFRKWGASQAGSAA